MASYSDSFKDRYKMGNPVRGKLVIINIQKFTNESVDERDGSEIDVKSLQKTFGHLGFRSEVHENKTTTEMVTIMKTVESTGLGGYDCLAIAIMTHGDDGGKICGTGGCDDIIELDTLFKPLKNLGDGKPKLIFIQACRGHKKDEGIMGVCFLQIDDAGQKGLKIPKEADFLYYFSTCPGYVAFRDKGKGSIFIQNLCLVLDQHISKRGEFDLLQCLTKVNQKVAEEYETKGGELEGKKQMPSFVSMLRKSIIFKGKP